MKAIHFSCTLPLFSSLILPLAPSPSSFLFLYMATSQKSFSSSLWLPSQYVAVVLCSTFITLLFLPLYVCVQPSEKSFQLKKKNVRKRKKERPSGETVDWKVTDGQMAEERRKDGKKGWKWWGMVDDEWSRCLDSEHRQRDGNWMEQKDWEADTEINRE